MRGADEQPGSMFSYVSLEERVPADHPLRAIRRITVVQHPWAARIAAEVGVDELGHALTAMRHLVAVLEADQPDHDE